MRKPNRTTIAIAAILLGTWTLPLTARAESKLTVLNGEWRGSGTDRNSPFESQQQTKCQSNNRVDLVRMVSDTVCTGETGLHKVSHLTITLDADKVVGTFDETASFPGSNASPRILKGSVSGVRAGDTATLKISFPGLIPSATVIFKLISSSSYSTQATRPGSTPPSQGRCRQGRRSGSDAHRPSVPKPSNPTAARRPRRASDIPAGPKPSPWSMSSCARWETNSNPAPAAGIRGLRPPDRAGCGSTISSTRPGCLARRQCWRRPPGRPAKLSPRRRQPAPPRV